jgi:activator of 2-hydroxyglutaryl-CoA dehydratase
MKLIINLTGEKFHGDPLPPQNKMGKDKTRILAIDPGTRHMGVALLEDGKLIYHGVKVIKKQKTPHATLKEARKVVLRIINDLKPDVLVFKPFSPGTGTSLYSMFSVMKSKPSAGEKGSRW